MRSPVRRVTLIILFAVVAANAGEFRTVRPVPGRAALPDGAVRLERPVAVRRDIVENALEQLAASWNTPALGGQLSPDFYDKDQLADTMATNVPRDASLRVLAIQGVRTLNQYAVRAPDRPGQLIVVSEVSVQARTQAEYNDATQGFQRRPGTNEYVFEVRQPLAEAEAAAATGAHADTAGQSLSLNGSNTIRGDRFWNFGDVAASPNEIAGFHLYDELGLNANWQRGAYQRLRLQSNLLFNDSDYRDPEPGAAVERINALYENGNTVPLRLELGDIYTDFSYRTIQRSLKGAQLELQPFGTADSIHSIQFAAGTASHTWNDVAWDEDEYAGASYLLRTPQLGRLSLNVVRQQQDETTDDAGIDQWVYGVAWERSLRLLAQDVTAEFEAAQFTGDHVNAQNRQDRALYLQLRGRNATPLSYRLRAERYGEDYRPGGAVITPARHSYEAHAAWAFDAGGTLRARYQNFRDNWQTDNHADTDTVGLAFTGSAFGGTTVSLDAFTQDRRSADHATDSISDNLRVDLSRPLTESTVGRLGVFLQQINDQTADDDDAETYELYGQLDQPFELGGWEGRIAPGIRYRRVTGPGDSDDWTPTLSLNLARGAHRLNLSAQALAQDRHTTDSIDADTYTVNAAYTYRTPRLGELGVEVASYDYDPRTGEQVHAYKIGAFWTVQFGRDVRRPRDLFHGGLDAWTAPPRRAPTAPAATGFAFRGLAPGTPLDVAKRAMAEFPAAIDLPKLTVAEARVLDDIDQRQRVAVVTSSSGVTGSALIVELDPVGGPDSMLQTFERVRRHFTRVLGRPDRFYEQGDVPADLAAAVNAGQFIRNFEWLTDSGVVRLGIPRRLDGQVRIEARYAVSLPTDRETLWSLERVR